MGGSLLITGENHPEPSGQRPFRRESRSGEKNLRIDLHETSCLMHMYTSEAEN